MKYVNQTGGRWSQNLCSGGLGLIPPLIGALGRGENRRLSSKKENWKPMVGHQINGTTPASRYIKTKY